MATRASATWLELFVLFSLRGGRACSAQPSERQHMRQNRAIHCKHFQRRSRAVFACADESTKPLVKPHLVRHAGNQQPLAHYSLLGNFAQLPFQLRNGKEVSQLLHAGLCSYSGKVPKNTAVPARLRCARFKAPRFLPWEHLASSQAVPQAAARLLRSTNDHDNMSDHQHHLTQGFFLRCYPCNVIRDMQQKTLL